MGGRTRFRMDQDQWATSTSLSFISQRFCENMESIERDIVTPFPQKFLLVKSRSHSDQSKQVDHSLPELPILTKRLFFPIANHVASKHQPRSSNTDVTPSISWFPSSWLWAWLGRSHSFLPNLFARLLEFSPCSQFKTMTRMRMLFEGR